MRKKYSTLTMLVLASLFSMSISGPPALAETTAGITMGTVDSADTAKVKVVKTLQPGDDIPDLLYGTTYTKQTSYNALTISGLTENNPLGTFTAGGTWMLRLLALALLQRGPTTIPLPLPIRLC